jgi:hypothetical protein
MVGGGRVKVERGGEKYRRHFRSMPNVFKNFGKYVISWKRIYEVG